jgi:hypothetical protein
MKSSLMAALLSGTAFLGVLLFIPSKNTKQKYLQESIPKETIPFEPIYKTVPIQKQKMKDEIVEDSLQLYAYRYNSIEKDPNLYKRSAIPFGKSSLLNSYPFESTFNSGIYSYYESEKLKIVSVSNGFKSLDSLYSATYLNEINKQNMVKRVDISYSINSVVSANVQSINSLSNQENVNLDDRIRVAPSTLAGFRFGSNKMIQAGFMTGETRLDIAKYINQGGMTTYLQREQEYKDSQDRRNLFEMHTSLQPTKNVKFQTAIYNTNKAFLNESGSSEGARFSMFFGFQNIAFNIKYNYSSDNFWRGIRSPDAVVNAKDYAGVGITFFLDSSKNYSLSLGNNYHNIIALAKYGESQNTPALSSFTASLRGSATNSNTTFFLNFRNQISKDTYYTNIGIVRIPIASQIYLEYATALGLEMSF